MVKMVQESFTILTPIEGEAIFCRIEEAARTCYQSSHKVAPGSAKVFVENIMKFGHESVLEHVSITVRFITNRGMTHELVRHRIGIAFSQESTRFCDYCGDKFGNEITVIDQRTFILNSMQDDGHMGCLEHTVEHAKRDNCQLCREALAAVAAWTMAMTSAEDAYRDLRKRGLSPEVARGVLPNDLKTDIVVTANLREWRHIFKLRTAKKAHFNIRGLMRKLCEEFKKSIPIIFDDIKW